MIHYPKRLSRCSLVLASLVLVLTAGVFPAGVNAAPACGSLFTDPPDDAPNTATGGDEENVDNLDIVEGGIAAVAADGTSFTSELNMKNLDNTLPTNATSMAWYFQWTYAEVNYFSRATITRTAPAPAYAFGTYDPATGRYTTTAATEGTFTPGENGSVQVVVPLDQVGAPPAGDTLTNTYGTTFIGTGAGVTLLFDIDRAPDGEGYGADYLMGSCEGGGDGGDGDLVSPGVRLRFNTVTPERGSVIKAKTSLATCAGHKGTDIRLQRKKSGRFVTIATKQLGDTCKAVFKVRAKFGKRTFRALWPKQDDDHARGVSKPVTVRTR